MADTKIVVNDSDIMAVVRVRNPQGGREEIFIQPMSRAAMKPGYTLDPVTFNNHPRVKVV